MNPGTGRSEERERGANRATTPAASTGPGGRAAGEPGGLGGFAFAGVGIQFAVTLVAFYYLGQWLDRRFGTAPVFLLVCVFAGAGGAFYAMYTKLMTAQRREEAARAAAKAAARGADAARREAPREHGR